jgi:nucleoside-diphosphate-sugar epimerase
MRIVIFGASGSTGRLLTEQALAAGHDVVAVTRQPADFPITHEQLSVLEADVHDGQAVDRAVEGADVVLSTLGVPFTRKPVTIYSDGIRNIIAAMSRHGVERVVVVSSTATEPHQHAGGGFLLYRVLLQLVIATFGKTSISDMRRMEALLRDSDLRWTIMRPSKLFDAPGVSSYQLHEGQAPGIFTSRSDLAASLLKQATDDRFVRKAVEVTTAQGVPTLLQLFRR